jgi:hypothetical protein
VFKSVLDTTRTDGKRRDEIFVDVVERLSMTFGAGGNVVAAQVDGAVQVRPRAGGGGMGSGAKGPWQRRAPGPNARALKPARTLPTPSQTCTPPTPRPPPPAPPQVKSYLAGNPPIKIKLNDDLLIAKRDNPYGGGGGFGGARALNGAAALRPACFGAPRPLRPGSRHLAPSLPHTSSRRPPPPPQASQRATLRRRWGWWCWTTPTSTRRQTWVGARFDRGVTGV